MESTFFVCADVQTKRSTSNYHIVTVVINMTDKAKCMTLEPVCLCVSVLLDGCGWVRQRTSEKGRIKTD